MLAFSNCFSNIKYDFPCLGVNFDKISFSSGKFCKFITGNDLFSILSSSFGKFI